MQLKNCSETTSIMKQRLIFFCALIFTAAGFITGCKHEIPYLKVTDNTPVITVPDCSPDTAYFQNTVQPLLNSSCAMSGCHSADSHKEGVILTSYSAIVNTGGIIPFNASVSKLYKVLNASGSDRMPRSPVPAFTQAQKDIIYKWINQGALNNSCAECDTTNFTYSGAIAPMMNTFCVGCHNASLTGGGYDFSNYDGVASAVLYERLLGSMQQLPDYSAMPQGGSRLSDCKITQVRKWIEAGAPNN